LVKRKADTFYNIQAGFTLTSGSVPPGYTTGGSDGPNALGLFGTLDVGSFVSSNDLSLIPLSPVILGGQGFVGPNLYHLQILDLGFQSFFVSFGDLVFPTPTGDLLDYRGGPIQSGFFTYRVQACSVNEGGVIGGDCPEVDFQYTLTSGSISLVTPLPAALPLFATGLGALGLLGWRRKKKAAVRA